ncbi:MAG: hypothetical protein R2695_03280 [Acidimicrobiales bacterium]
MSGSLVTAALLKYEYSLHVRSGRLPAATAGRGRGADAPPVH